MASRIRRRCTWSPTCPNPALPGGKCELHARAADAARNLRRITSLEVYRSKRWKKLRRAVLLDHPYCTAEGCQRPATDVDHIERIELRPDLAFETRNLQSLCRSCHARKTALETGFGGRHE